MSSTSIQAEIVNCQNIIAQKQTDITNLQHKIETQEYTKACFANKRNDFIAEYFEKKVKETMVSEYVNTSVFTYRYHQKSESYISAGKEACLEDNLNTIETIMQTEINSHKQKLEELKRQLSWDKTRLEQLNCDYNRALAEEEAERQRAAAAAQAANTTGGNRGGKK